MLSREAFVNKNYFGRISGVSAAFPLFIIVLLIAAFFVFFHYRYPGPYAIAGAALFLFAITVGTRSETIPAIFLAYIMLAPSLYTEIKSPFFAVLYIPYVAPVAIFASYFMFKINKTAESVKGIYVERSQSKTDFPGIIVTLILFWLIFQSFRGLALGYPYKHVIFEFCYAIVIAGYFIWRHLFRSDKELNIWMIFYIGVALLTAFQLLTVISTLWESIFNFLFTRIITRQGHVTLVSFPMLLAFLVSTKKWRYRILILAALLVTMMHVLITQQRALMLASAISFMVMFTLFAFRNGFTKKGFILWLSGIVMLVSLMVGVIIWAMNLFNVDIDIILGRWQEFGSLQDQSTLLRVFDIREAMRYVSYNPILGMGLGSKLMTVPNAIHFFFMDNSYIMILFKGGIPHLLLISVLYLTGLWYAWKVYRNAEEVETRLFAAGLISALLAIMFTGATNVCMIFYRFGFIWMMVLAASTFLYEKMKLNNRELTETAGQEA